jgi:radical SAM/Cys-rich protein
MSQSLSFHQNLAKQGLGLRRASASTLQVNVGKFCNQACHHCHVEAGPKRPERMDKATAERILTLISQTPSITVVDITGGAPELNENFRFLVTEARALGCQVIDRCNLTVLFEPGQEDLAQFLLENKVQIVASLPCYQRENVDKQRGSGVFSKSIAALELLNRMGFGKPDSELTLDLVYNPGGALLPPDQQMLEQAYRKELLELFGIEFSRLFTITNMPISRFLRQLEREGKLSEYMDVLVNAFNPASIDHLMCRSLVSVSWDGLLFDCDFNQMLEIPIAGIRKTIWEIEDFNSFESKAVATANHCYACTAGAGSSCGGALVG